MNAILVAYAPAIYACVALAALILVQVLVADFAGIRNKHVPGMPVTEGHSSFLFRSVRALANTNEILGLFLLLMGCALMLQASPAWINALAWVFVAARIAHTVSYYARWGMVRGAAFGIGLTAQAGLLIACLLKLF